MSSLGRHAGYCSINCVSTEMLSLAESVMGVTV